MKNTLKRIKSWFTFRVRATFRIRSLERRCDALDRARTKAEESIDRAAVDAAAAYSSLQATVATAQNTMRQQVDTIQDLRSTVANQALEIDQQMAIITRDQERVRTETATAIRGQALLEQPRDSFGAR